MSGERLLKEIGDFCRDAGLAESTFGRLAINDGKLVSRLRDGGRITTETLDRLRIFMEGRRETSLHANAGKPRRMAWPTPAPSPNVRAAQIVSAA